MEKEIQKLVVDKMLETRDWLIKELVKYCGNLNKEHVDTFFNEQIKIIDDIIISLSKD